MMTAPARRLITRALAVAAVAAAGIALSGCSLLNQVTNTTQRDGDGKVTATNEDADVFSIKVGDCLNDADVQGETTTTPIVPCSKEHDSEAFQHFILDDGDYPGDDAIEQAGESDCGGQAFTDFIGVASDSSVIGYSYYYPTKDSWGNGDREIMCTVYQMDESGNPVKTTGSLKGIGK
jgi:hypothetical protein